MTPETKAELLRLVEAGDLTALALKVGERWLETCYPTWADGLTQIHDAGGRFLGDVVLTRTPAGVSVMPRVGPTSS
jgi:hypothetical protein